MFILGGSSQASHIPVVQYLAYGSTATKKNGMVIAKIIKIGLPSRHFKKYKVNVNGL